MTSEGRPGFPTATCSFVLFRFDYLVRRWSRITLLNINQRGTGSEKVGSLRESPQEKQVLDQSQKAVQVQHHHTALPLSQRSEVKTAVIRFGHQ